MAKDDALAFLWGRINFERTAPSGYSKRTFKLQRMRRLLNELGDPDAGLNIVHVAGTKGKGSTAAMIAAMFTAAGIRTGLYSSPHLHGIEERLAIGGRPCPVDELIDLIELARPVVEGMDRQAAPPDSGPTFFELTTALALTYFARRDVDAAVLEVGLGGRLDSTNVCRPKLCIITNISFDHTELLGRTLAKIAREKAGIIKPEVPVISGVLDGEAQEVIHATCRQLAAPCWQLGRDFHFDYDPPRDVQREETRGKLDVRFSGQAGRRHYAGIELSLLGRHQAGNAALATAAVEQLRRQAWTIPTDAVREGLAAVRWPARIEVVQRNPCVILDAAHNTASIEALLATLDESFHVSRRILVFGTTADKDAAAMLAALLPRFDEVIFTQYVKNPRAVPPSALAAHAPNERTRIRLSDNPHEAWRRAGEIAKRKDLICITGSFYLAAEMKVAMSGDMATG